MGFYGVIPATSLSAFYDVKKQTLILSAKGVVPGATSGFGFARDAFFGGLKFTLGAWTGPITGKEQPYEFSQAFKIHLPQPHFNSASVLIVTSNHPEGETVIINYGGLIEGQGTEKAATVENPSANATVSTASPDAVFMRVLFGQPFNIVQNAIVPKFGAVDIKYDKTALKMETAGISDTDIVWTFNSLKIGETQVIVTIFGGISQIVFSKTYNILVIEFDEE